jgi:tripartite-type tricarboxylate transporter receptor subunit TctC
MRLIVPLAVGGGTDLVSRLVAVEMSRQLGQSVVVENIAGGSTTIATSTVVRAAPDGYTMLTGTPSLSINPSLRKDLRYDALKDLQPVSLLSRVPYVLVAGPSRKVRKLAELLELARSKPGSISVGSPGIGSGGHLAAELFQMLSGVKLLHVPYKGSGPALNDLRAGQIDLLFGTSPAVTNLIEQNVLTALGVSTTARMNTLPMVPTIAEAGVPGFEATSWYGIFVPAKTPLTVINKLNAAAAAALQTQRVTDAIRADGGEPSPSTPEELQAYLAREIAKWSTVIKKAGIQS